MAEERRISPAILILPVGLGLGLVLAVATTAWAAPPTPPPGKATLYGRVTDAITEEPISGVYITLDGSQGHSDAGGNYIFEDLEPGEYMLQFSKENYETATY